MLEQGGRPLHERYAPKELPGGVLQIPKEVHFYLLRLNDLAETRKSIDRGEFPVSSYEGVPMLPGQVEKDQKDLQPTNYGKGLRFGVSHAITGTRSILCAMGYQKESDFILKMHRNTAREKQQKSQQEGKL